MSRSGSTNGGPNASGPQRPNSGASNRRNASNPPNANDSGAESKKGGNDNSGAKKPDQQRPKPQGNNNPRGGNNGNRKPSQGSRHNNARESVSRQSSGRQNSGSPATAPVTSEGSDALTSLQRVIADLKTASPSVQSANMNNPLGGVSAPVPIPTSQSVSNLPVNAPVFQPGAAAFPGSAGNEAPRHRKAASLGAGGSFPNNFNSYSPNLGSMMEDIEEAPGGASFEEGEIQEAYVPAAGAHQRRSLSQSFTAPRFAALAAQQEQVEAVGPTGRPQLAPNFMFGRRRPSAAMPMGPPISEEDMGFQFPQQHAQQNFHTDASSEQTSHRRTESSGEISGIMAEQVQGFVSLITVHNLIKILIDRYSEPD
jgi:protein SSD1